MTGDWKRDLGKMASGSGGSAVQRKCKDCGKPLKPDSKFDTCFECGQKRKEGGGAAAGIPKDYVERLEKGYFDSNGRLWEEFVTTMAKDVAQSFGKKLKNYQLRRFYGHAKAAENRLRMTGDWPSVNVDIKKLGAFVAEAKGKDKIPESFYDFIDRNIKAIKMQKDFDAFLEHFQAVVAYFTYFNPKD